MNSTLILKKRKLNYFSEIELSGSKSETNRLLILNALYGNPITLQNISNSEDSQLLQKALNSGNSEIDIHHAGTAMRFLTAYLSIQENKTFILTGSERMKQRPIGILVNALKELGAEISYLEKSGFPPLEIKGKKLKTDFVELAADTSSQFITALMLIAPKLENGLTLNLKGKITSKPYLEMTLNLLKKIGIYAEFIQNRIQINHQPHIEKQTHSIESDWSSASYFYSMMALSADEELHLNAFYKESLQGDSEVAKIYEEYFGVITTYVNESQILLHKTNSFKTDFVELDLNKTPDLAQTIAVTCAALKRKCKLKGLETLKIKETDRLLALKKELIKIGAEAEITSDSLEITEFFDPLKVPLIETFNDHRMALSFAPFSLKGDIEIENPEVIQKSYPQFWKDFKKITSIERNKFISK